MRALTHLAAEDVVVVGDPRHQVVVLVDDLLALQGRQPAQLHVEDRRRLDLVDLEQVHQAGASVVDRGRCPDQRDDVVEGVERLEVAAQDVRALLRLAQAVGGPTLDDLDLVRDPVADELLEGQRARHAIDEGEHVGAEVVLQLGVLEELVQHHLRHGIALELDDQAHAGPRRRVVADVGDPGELPVAHQLRDAQQQVVGVDLVRQLRDHEDLTTAGILVDLDDGAHRDGSAAGAIGVVDALAADDQRTGGEVRSLDEVHERGLALGALGLRIREQPLSGRRDLAQVVRRDVRRHADGDAGTAVDEQVREPARQHQGLEGAAVVVGAEVDGLLVDVAHHLHGHRGHAALGVALGGRRIVSRGAEVALALHQRVPQRPRLREAHEGVVDRAVAVRVVAAHDVADDAGALGEVAIGSVATVVHRVQDAAMHRLQAVADIRQRARHDDGHRVVEVRALHLRLQVDRIDAAMRTVIHHFGGVDVVSHGRSPSVVGACVGGRSRLDVEEAHVAGVLLDEVAA